MKKKRIIIALAVLVILAIAAGLLYVLWFRKGTKEDVKLKDNQKWVYAQVSSIYGNDMNVNIATAEEIDVSSMKGNRQTSGNAKTNQSSNGSGQMSSGSDNSGGQMQRRNGSFGGQMPGDNDSSGSGQDSFGMGQERNSNSSLKSKTSNDSSTNSKSSEKADATTQQQVQYVFTLTGDSKQYMIPVGTTVTTSLGATTTFSRLRADDYVKMLIETDDNENEAILGIWIVG